MHDFFHTLPRNFGNCFLGKNIIFHLAAIALTYVIVTSGLDWWFYLATGHIAFGALSLPAAFIGGIVPIVVPLCIFAFGQIGRSARAVNTALALAQAAVLGSGISSIYKAFTGRIHPEFIRGVIDSSRQFNFGFLREGIFWGWPSSHATIAFATAITFFILYREKWWKWLALAYAIYIGIGVSTTIHWFSEAVAGALIGIAVGLTVGKSFKKKHFPQLERVSKVGAWIRDYAYLFSTGSKMYLRRTPPKHYLEHVEEGKVPVVILPGIFGRWSFLKEIGDHLSMLGHPIYIVPKLGDNVHDLPKSAKLVREVVEENNLRNVIIVAHSKGGLITKYLMLHEDPEMRIKGLIAIATPFHGSNIGAVAPLGSILELSPENKIIQDLERHSEYDNKIVSIIPSYDNHVWHEKGSHLDGALANVRVEIPGHHLLLGDKGVWKIVEEWIEKITVRGLGL